MKIKYTREELEPLIKESTSIAQVIRKLGLKLSGGNYTHIGSVIKKYELDTSHFLGKAANCGENHKCGERKSWKEILVVRNPNQHRQKAYQLRRALIESGREYICECCKLDPVWNGKELRLQVDHKNGKWFDNRKRNLRFLCPNCHAQTEASGGNGLSEVTSQARYFRERRKNKNNNAHVSKLVNESG